MPAAVTIDTELGHILLRAEGVQSDEEFLAALRTGYSDARFRPDMLGLGEYTAVTDNRLTAAAVIAAAKLSRFDPRSRQATLVADLLSYGLARMNTAYANEAANGVPGVFQDRAAALQCLNQGYPPRTFTSTDQPARLKLSRNCCPMRRITWQTFSRTAGSVGETWQPRRSPSSHVSSRMICSITGN